MSENTPKPYVPEWVTKRDVATRQICAAVRMFFERADPVVAHSVISGGHQILTDLCHAESKHTLLRRKDGAPEHIRSANVAANFFKHADRDPDKRLNIQPLDDLNAEFLMDASFMLISLHGNDAPMPAKVFCSWFVSMHPELFENVTQVARFTDFDIDPTDFKKIALFLTFAEVMEGVDLTGEQSSKQP